MEVDLQYDRMTEFRNGATDRFRELMARRLFVDHEPGALLVWLDADRHELSRLVARVEANHPAARFTVQTSGAAVAVRIAARDEELVELVGRYLGDAR